MSLKVVRTVADLRSTIHGWRAEGLTFGYVPTMGALHDGHLSLVSHALELTDRVGASIFVNPTQFGEGEDFSAYPRHEDDDLAKLDVAGAHLAFLPSVDEMYAKGAATTVRVSNGLSETLEGTQRPGHFDGVATVVSKLLMQALPDVAVFGEKDYQQLCVIKRLVKDLHIPVRIKGGQTVREDDGLAMSSRNAYLSPEQRAMAVNLYMIMIAVAEEVAEGTDIQDACHGGALILKNTGFDEVDYLEVRDAETLAPLTTVGTRPARILVAARMGKTRLIDNIPLEHE